MNRGKGRFRQKLDPGALRFSSSLHLDLKMAEEDIQGSLAHVGMLADRGVIIRKDARDIARALKEIRAEIATGSWDPEAAARGQGRLTADDIHMAIEQRVIAKVGPRGGVLHTGRSRNDQVALDERIYLKKAIRLLNTSINALQKALLKKARQYQTVVMPGYTHLQRGQPVLLAHHLLAYVGMLERDAGRFSDCHARVNMSPLGAAALAGTSFPVDRSVVARALGFDGVLENSIDAVSDRDVQTEFISACAITMMHLSRLSEELVLWSSEEWGFVEMDERFATGSSIMPQKKNPDIAELVRGKTGRVYGDLVGLLTVMKGLPLAYNRDMQEDKVFLFDAAETLTEALQVSVGMLKGVRFNRKRFTAELESGFVLATELADYLVRKGLPFREAHAMSGDLVRECIKKKCTLKELPLEVYQRHSPLFARDLYRLLDVEASLKSKKSRGSTAPREVERALSFWEKKFSRASR
ncbi:MAG: argininosuccinate lyase [Bacteroidota bacterium]